MTHARNKPTPQTRQSPSADARVRADLLRERRIAELRRMRHAKSAAAAYAPPIIASNWRPIRRNSLIGSADLYVRKWRFTFYGALWHRKGEREWISLPAREWTGTDGKRVFSALGKFSRHGDARRFSEPAIEAIKRIAGEDAARGEAAQVKISGLAPPPSPRRGHALYAPARRVETAPHLPDDEIADLWPPAAGVAP